MKLLSREELLEKFHEMRLNTVEDEPLIAFVEANTRQQVNAEWKRKLFYYIEVKRGD